MLNNPGAERQILALSHLHVESKKILIITKGKQTAIESRVVATRG